MKTKKEMKISKASIVFYVASVIFLAIAAFEIYQAYLTVESYKTTYTLQLTEYFLHYDVSHLRKQNRIVKKPVSRKPI